MKQAKKVGKFDSTQQHVIKGAVMFKKATTDLEKGRNFFGKWLADKACGHHITPEQQDQIFNAAYQTYDIMATAATLPTGAGAALDAFRLGKIPWKGLSDLGDKFNDLGNKVNPPTTSAGKHARTLEVREATATSLPTPTMEGAVRVPGAGGRGSRAA
jgi:hypothetical protein